MKEVKEGDVYVFRYKDTKDRFEPYHCFDGTLIARVKGDGELHFVDTYWELSDSRCFTIEDAFRLGKMKFLCNLECVDNIDKSNTKYYDEDDVIHLRIHAGYRDKYYIKKGTKRSKYAMMKYIKRKIRDEESNIKYSKRQIEICNDKLKEVESGNVDIYI